MKKKLTREEWEELTYLEEEEERKLDEKWENKHPGKPLKKRLTNVRKIFEK